VICEHAAIPPCISRIHGLSKMLWPTLDGKWPGRWEPDNSVGQHPGQYAAHVFCIRLCPDMQLHAQCTTAAAIGRNHHPHVGALSDVQHEIRKGEERERKRKQAAIKREAGLITRSERAVRGSSRV
jgi:hypothetical protein